VRILLVEDEAPLAGYLNTNLGHHGYLVDHIARGDHGLAAVEQSRYDLMIVDRMLPGLDGLSLVKQLRQADSTLPILILSNLGGLDDRVEGLNAGADDYLAKPFAFSELLARVNALLRRPSTGPNESSILEVGDVALDRIKRKVVRAGQPVALQPREFALLEYLMVRQGQIVTRTMLLEGVWNFRFDPKTHIVETHMSRLRSKLGVDLIHTIRGSGYMLRAPNSDA
jgi:two-component system, OmpR family, response regulator